MTSQQLGLFPSIGLLILRVGIGGYISTHGWGKLQTILAGDFAGFPDPIGLGSGLSLVLAMIAELICGLLVAIGMATRPAAVVVVFAMAVAAFGFHAADPWMMGEGPSKEPALVYLFAFLALAFTGAGRFSFDQRLVPTARPEKDGSPGQPADRSQ